ncbi:MAG TPA: Gfo/Idh/MocA family oxidoreductase [Streptosporangiaceae bacterium]|nr:Gfo/Idh/MocA family oxidoreductase [Streptosporangiaceae bacterium]
MEASTPAPARIAVVGTGNIARVHAAALRSLPGADLVAAADVDRARLHAFGAEHGVPQLHADLAELLEAARPDLVHLCTPPALHYQQADLCLRAGVSVLVEKPPALSPRELDLLAASEAARGDAGPWFATVFQHRFGSGARRLRAVAAAGVLGRPLLAICHTTWFRDQAYFDVPWRGRWESEGGGPTMGHGIHQLDLLRYVLGDWAEISAIARRQARRMETEDLSMAHVIFFSGAAASVINCAEPDAWPPGMTAGSARRVRAAQPGSAPADGRRPRPSPPDTTQPLAIATPSDLRACQAVRYDTRVEVFRSAVLDAARSPGGCGGMGGCGRGQRRERAGHGQADRRRPR